MEYGGWDAKTEGRLRGLLNDLSELHQRIRPARNRLLGHNDLSTILADVPIGKFEAGLDDRYFDALQSFASLVRETGGGVPFRLDALARTDVAVLLKALVDAAAAEA